MTSDTSDSIAADSETVAATFVNSRRNNLAFTKYPGNRPATLEAAYAIQDLGIRMWPSPVAGWKVGGIDADNAKAYGVNRLVGPVFSEKLWTAEDAPAEIGVLDEGFAAIEGEVVVILKEDAPVDKTDWSTDEALALVGSLRAGAEIASSPYPYINDEGPLVTISDLGNNFGLIVGDEIPNWRDLRLNDWVCRTFIDDELIGEKTPSIGNGGPIESLRFLLANTARRRKPLKKGMAVCTGAVTGVHDVKIGQTVRIEFDGAKAIEFGVVRSMPTRN